jgi:hypothetical protein
MAFTCVELDASQIRKKSAMASGIFRISREMMFSPFFSSMAFTAVLNKRDFRVSLVFCVAELTGAKACN